MDGKDTLIDRFMDALLEENAKNGPDEPLLAEVERAVEGKTLRAGKERRRGGIALAPLAWAALLVASTSGAIWVIRSGADDRLAAEDAASPPPATAGAEESAVPMTMPQEVRLRVEDVVSAIDQTPTRISLTYKVGGQDHTVTYSRGVNWPEESSEEGANFPFHPETIPAGRSGVAVYFGRLFEFLTNVGADSPAEGSALVVETDHGGSDKIPDPAAAGNESNPVVVIRDSQDLTAFVGGFRFSSPLRTFIANDTNVVAKETGPDGKPSYPSLAIEAADKRFGVRRASVESSSGSLFNQASGGGVRREAPPASPVRSEPNQQPEGEASEYLLPVEVQADAEGAEDIEKTWPAPRALVTGIDSSAYYETVPPVAITLTGLRNGSTTYLRVYPGSPDEEPSDVTRVSASVVMINDDVPQKRTLLLRDLDRYFVREGLHTLEILYELPPATEILYRGQIRVDRTIEAVGSLTTSDESSPAPAEGSLQNRERYGELAEQPWKSPWEAPLSTFSVDVDTASYTNLRRLLRDGAPIPRDAVRLEECVNYFDYGYEAPKKGGPFAVHVDLAACPWNEAHHLAKIGIKGKEVPNHQRPPTNLVFLIDVSGSMNDARKLPLLVESMKVLVEELDERDSVGIVVYAGAAGTLLEPTRVAGEGRAAVIAALDGLSAGGSTAGAAGIRGAYELAAKHYRKDGVNRVILATDGDFNVGTSTRGELVDLVKEQAASGVYLSVLGFGAGNLNDSMMEAITNDGNGNYFYIDSQREGRKVFLQNLSGTLVTIAKDVKLQVEFNPGKVAAYRLLGYANRRLRDEDFNNDKVDAGDIGAGHTVTALYEIVPAGVEPPATGAVDALKYQKPEGHKLVESADWMTVKLRYKAPDGEESSLLKVPVAVEPTPWSEVSLDFSFAAAVSLFAEKLRGSEQIGDVSWEGVTELARRGSAVDRHGHRAEFLELLGRAAAREAGQSPDRPEERSSTAVEAPKGR